VQSKTQSVRFNKETGFVRKPSRISKNDANGKRHYTAHDGEGKLMISRCTYEPRYDMQAARDRGTQQQISLPIVAAEVDTHTRPIVWTR
jgi:hypothetical protein